MAEREEAVQAIIDAIRNEGPVPAWHRRVMNRHRADWPTLWAALDNLMDAERKRDGGR